MIEVASTQPYPELHQEFNELQFYTCLRDLMTMAGYASFSWRDIHCPTPKRLRYQLSAIINLAKYREEQLRVYAELNEPRIALIQALDDVNAENAELQEQEQQVIQESKEQFHELEQVMRECEELEVEISRNNKLQAAARHEAAEIKKTANDLKDQVATAVWALQEAEAEEEKLRSKIVSSPDRRKNDVMVRKERLRKVKEECDQIETSIQACRTKIANATRAVQDLESTNALLDDLQEQANTYTELVRKTEESRKRYLSMQKKNEAIEKQMEEISWQLARTDETIMHQRKQHKLHMDAVLEALEEAKSVLLRVERERREGIARIEAGEAEVQAIADAMDQEREQNDADINAMIEEYKMVEEAFLRRNQRRMDAIAICPP
jgi:kinetochore protein Nuf2